MDQRATQLYAMPTCLYRLFDVFGRLLYVGISSDLKRRWKEHRKKHWWWPQVVERREEWFDDRGSAFEEERATVRTELPLHNAESWGDMTGGLHPPLPAGVPERPPTPEGEDWFEDTVAASHYWLSRNIWRAQLRDAAPTPEELAVILAGRG
ncbi:GIY-YIG nuclease family protein [Streptomyces zaomyceticus]|uniref:GIY-YIG nuclease family protein n=1 Tax=Streptomyces zaomyceticus TaxID=68286 RepID=UPI00371EC930